MRPQSNTRERDIADLATRQHGVVAHYQLVALGFEPRAVRRRVEAGRLHRIHRGVYAAGHSVLARDGRFMAAVLAVGRAQCSAIDMPRCCGACTGPRARLSMSAPRAYSEAGLGYRCIA